MPAIPECTVVALSGGVAVNSLRKAGEGATSLAKIVGCATAVLTMIAAGIGVLIKWKDYQAPAGGAPAAVVADPKPPPAPPARRPVLDVVRDDLAGLAPAARRGRRYLALDHLPDGPELDRARADLDAVAAFLSPPGVAAVVRRVDPAGVVFAFEPAAFGMDPGAAWAAVLRAYPYGLEPAGPAGVAVREQSGTPLAVVRGDWFVRAAVNPPLAAPGAPFHRPAVVPAGLRAAARRYDEARVDAKAAAADLGLPDPSRVAAAVRAEEHLRTRFGLGPLADGGSVARAAWESTEFVTSGFQELARELNVGTPLRAE